MPLLPGMKLPAGTEENNPRNDKGRVTLALVLRDTRSTAVVCVSRKKPCVERGAEEGGSSWPN